MTKVKPTVKPAVVPKPQGGTVISTPTPKGPNPELLPSVSIEPTEVERQVIIRMVERIPPSARMPMERNLLSKATNRRKRELELSGAERYAIQFFIGKTQHKQRSDAEKSLWDKV